MNKFINSTNRRVNFLDSSASYFFRDIVVVYVFNVIPCACEGITPR